MLGALGGLASAAIGAIGANRDAKRQEKANKRAIKASQQGFRYLRDNENVQQAQQRGLGAATQIDSLMDSGFQPGAIEQGGQAQGQIGALLGLGGDQEAARRAFGQFQDSTGFQSQLDAGMDAITGSGAARGLLNSGATLKALNTFGQNLGQQSFGRYFNMLQGVQNTGLNQFSNRLNQFGNIQGTGLEAAYNVASQGTSAGSQAAQLGMQGASRTNAIRQGGRQEIASGLGTALGGLSDFAEQQGFFT